MFDGGRGIAALGSAVVQGHPRFRKVRRIHVLITHAHMDHWEGLKDTDWFWARENGLAVTMLGRPEALETIRRAYQHPAYVPLDRLARGTLARLCDEAVELRERFDLGRWSVETFPLNHYSGCGSEKRWLDTVGYRVTSRRGAVFCYLSDHEPTAETKRGEREATRDAMMVLFDSTFVSIAEHAFGHGSQEYTASVARESPEMAVLAAHHGPNLSDLQIRAGFRKWRRSLPNFHLAVEGETYRWNEKTGTFEKRDVAPSRR